MTGQHIQIFLVDGIAGGVTTAEIVGWTGHVLFGPRSNLGELLKRREADRNGVYMLLGDDAGVLGGVRCYIGRTESFRDRFSTHKRDVTKDFFDRVVLIAARDDSITEGHWGYLESRLVDPAKQAKRVAVDNAQTPQGHKCRFDRPPAPVRSHPVARATVGSSGNRPMAARSGRGKTVASDYARTRSRASGRAVSADSTIRRSGSGTPTAPA